MGPKIFSLGKKTKTEDESTISHVKIPKAEWENIVAHGPSIDTYTDALKSKKDLPK